MRENRPAAASRAAYELWNDPVSSDATWRRRTSFSSGVVERPATTAMERRWSVRRLRQWYRCTSYGVAWLDQRADGRRDFVLTRPVWRVERSLASYTIDGWWQRLTIEEITVANSSEQRQRPDSAETDDNRSVFWRTFSSRINKRVSNVTVKFDTGAPTLDFVQSCRRPITICQASTASAGLAGKK